MKAEKVLVSQNINQDFAKADFYRNKITKEVAQRLFASTLDVWYEYALKRGWTKAETAFEYAEKEHGAIYAAVFQILF